MEVRIVQSEYSGNFSVRLYDDNGMILDHYFPYTVSMALEVAGSLLRNEVVPGFKDTVANFR